MPTPGRTSVGRYELRGRLGRGGMGTVWHAWDPALQRDVAVKEVLLPQGMSADERAEAHARTLREAQATARISHTSVVTIHDVLDHGDSPWIVMELLSGASLQSRIDTGGPMPVERVEEAARALLGGLRAAHAAGVTHRDVKPANIMCTEDDRTVLTDFGIANVDGGTALTQTGVYIGSPEYMAPERFEGERALPASDLWSLGVTLYCLLEGRSPFRRDSITGMISAVMTAPVPSPSRNGAADSPRSRALCALISALLTREVAARPGPAEALDLLAREGSAARALVDTGRAVPSEAGGPDSSGAPPVSGPDAGTPVPHTGGDAAPDRVTPNPDRQVPVAPPRPPDAVHQTPSPLHHTPNPLHHTPDPTHQTPNPHRPAPTHPTHDTVAPVRHAPPPTHRTPNPLLGAPGGSGTPSGAHPSQRWSAPPPAGYPHAVAAHRPAPDAGSRFLDGVGHTGSGSATDDAEKPAAVLTAMVMLGINALVLFVLTAVGLGRVGDDGADTSWGGVVFLGVWGVLSAFGVFGVLTRSRLVFALVVIGQGVGAVFLAMSMFTVFIYTPELMVVYTLMLLYTLGIGGLLLLPGRSRAYFGLG
ncbi:protein kinase [Nocardiopsis sp. NPDC007018]|uniref:serine/threonine-protein kinase n=1 Tax=Nocardiopsis sp. NPDC007018 TaxID=3155721 RepID=UPI0033DCBF3D